MPWVTIPNSVFETGKPARALDMRNLRDNFTAMGAGDAGAPKVKGVALSDVFIADGNNDSTGLVVANLSRAKVIKFEASLTTASMQIAFSNDNGATWGSNQTVATIGSTLVAFLTCVFGLDTGVYRVVGVAASASTSTGTAGTMIDANGTLTVPSNANAVRIRRSTGSGGGILVYAIGGRA